MSMDRHQQRRHNNREIIYTTDGNNARKLMAVPEYEHTAIPQRRKVERVQRREKAAKAINVNSGIDFLSMIFLSALMIVTVFACFRYLEMQSTIKDMDKTILSLEQDLGKLTDKNNSLAMEFDKAIDFDHIYQTAVLELGMVFPNNNQVISYKNKANEYIKQYEIVEEVKLSVLLDNIFQ